MKITLLFFQISQPITNVMNIYKKETAKDKAIFLGIYVAYIQYNERIYDRSEN